MFLHDLHAKYLFQLYRVPLVTGRYISVPGQMGLNTKQRIRVMNQNAVL
jgi:hypothetical protein